MNQTHPAEQFAQDVQNGVTPAGHDISALCCTHNEDRRQEKDAIFPFEFDEAAAITYVENMSVLPPKMSPAEQFFIWRAFGWVSKATGARRYSQEAF